MKKLLLSVVALMLLTGLVSGRDKQDFDKFLKTVHDNTDNYASEKYYEKLEYTNSKTGEKKKFSDFSEMERAIYMILRCDGLSHEMEDLYNKWKEELKNADETPDNEKDASKKDVTEYLDKLLLLRKKNAEKIESMIDDLFKKWPDQFTKEEKEYIAKSIREYHDKNNLVKRDK